MMSKNEVQKEDREIEVRVNDSIRILFKIPDKMDPMAFMEMMNHVKGIVKQNAPAGSIVRRDRVGSEERVGRLKLVADMLKKGATDAEIMKKISRSHSVISTMKREIREKGMI